MTDISRRNFMVTLAAALFGGFALAGAPARAQSPSQSPSPGQTRGRATDAKKRRGRPGGRSREFGDARKRRAREDANKLKGGSTADPTKVEKLTADDIRAGAKKKKAAPAKAADRKKRARPGERKRGR